MTDTTDKLVEQIKADRDAGTPGKWSYYKKGHLNRVEAVRAHGSVCVAGIHKIGSKGGSVDGCFEANARRIARVPDMEARIIELTEARARDAETIKAAKELAEAANTLMTQCEDGDGFTEGAAITLDCAIAAFNAALEKDDD